MIEENELIQTSLKAQIFGRRYSKGNVVILGKDRGILQFGQIENIIWKNAQAYLFFKKITTVGLNSTVGAYIVKHLDYRDNSPASSAFSLFATSELLDFHPLDISMPFSDHDMYIRLRYHVI